LKENGTCDYFLQVDIKRKAKIWNGLLDN
jgi:hypothetical protein